MSREMLSKLLLIPFGLLLISNARADFRGHLSASGKNNELNFSTGKNLGYFL